jgi:Ca-activated chloride channel homolog
MHLMQKPQTPGYLRNIILMTDGDLGNEEQIFAAMKQNLNGARLFTTAIGSAPNMFLATKMAQFGRGTFTHIADVNEVQKQMTNLLEQISSPVLTDVSVAFDGVQVADIYPDRLPDLFARQPLLIYGRIVKGSKGIVHLRARAGNASYDSGLPFDTSGASYHPGITTLWARQFVEQQMDRLRDADDKAQADIKSAIIAHAIQYHLVTRFTSFVAVEEIVANTSSNSRSVGVATELPAGMQLDKVFGAPATGTTDEFFQTLGITLLILGAGFALVLWKAGALS